MKGDTSAYEVLGLEPGADQSAIERAYKSLIKRYHPDRAGGDAKRASEINHAYFQLRKPIEQAPERSDPATVAEALYARRAAHLKRRRPKRKFRLWPMVLLVAATVAYFKREAIGIFAEDLVAEARSRIEPPVNDGSDAGVAPGRTIALDGPIARGAIVESVRRAKLLHRAGDEGALAEESRSCHQQLRAAPTLLRLDRCAAFDDAVLELQQRDPLGDEGPFGATAVTARQISAATLLTNDYLAIEARLDRVRSRVQQQLAPPPPDLPSGSVTLPSGSGLPQPAP